MKLNILGTFVAGLVLTVNSGLALACKQDQNTPVCTKPVQVSKHIQVQASVQVSTKVASRHTQVQVPVQDRLPGKGIGVSIKGKNFIKAHGPRCGQPSPDVR